MRLYLIRHGQSTNNALQEGEYHLRSSDPHLTDIGRQQTQHVAQFLRQINESGDADRFGITHLYVSPMRRALHTARPIADALGLTPEVWIDIHEGGGIFEDREGVVVGLPGMTRAEITTEFSDYTLPETITEAGWWDVNSGEETIAAMFRRAVDVALALRMRAREEENLALVSHAGFLDALLRALFNQLPGTRKLYYHHLNCAVTRLFFYSQTEVAINYLNNHEFIPVDLRTW